jgi:hypothetical protein
VAIGTDRGHHGCRDEGLLLQQPGVRAGAFVEGPTVVLDDTIPLGPRYDHVAHVHALRRLAADVNAPPGKRLDHTESY